MIKQIMTPKERGGGAVLYKGLYGKALPQGPTPHPLHPHNILKEKVPLSYTYLFNHRYSLLFHMT